jgi:TRAP transporter 4TM/12TM fusion protein
VFLFVLLGALLEKAGAGQYFIDVAYALLGRYRGGPAKAAILASGFTGMVNGSSVANVVTTGSFTIPLMKQVGYPPHKAAAIEVAASTNGQLMPPIMGAAAFIIAEFIGVSYLDVVTAATIPAVASYFTLFYISHLEAVKLGLKSGDPADLPRFWLTFLSGVHYLVPVAALVVSLLYYRHSPMTAAFTAMVWLLALMAIQRPAMALLNGGEVTAAIRAGFVDIYEGMVTGARNMAAIGVATAVAGIIVGVVTLTGLGLRAVEIVETLSMGSFGLMLVITAAACLILGMGLPTTANYIVMATLTAPVLVALADKSGFAVPLIAVHLFVFYFGILADDTPPVGLAAYAAAGIAGADPIRTGLQGFYYDIRTAILPFMFIFNTKILLIGVESVWHGLFIFGLTVGGMFAFASATQGYATTKLSPCERALLLVVALTLVNPHLVDRVTGLDYVYIWSAVGAAVYAGLLVRQRVG